MLTLFNKVRRRLASHLVGFVSVVIANFSQGLLCSAAAHQIGLRMKQFGDFQQFFLARHDTTTAEPICSLFTDGLRSGNALGKTSFRGA